MLPCLPDERPILIPKTQVTCPFDILSLCPAQKMMFHQKNVSLFYLLILLINYPLQ